MSKHSEAVIRSQRKHRERFNAYRREYWSRPENLEKRREHDRKAGAWRKAKARDARFTPMERKALAPVRQAERYRRWKEANPERAAELGRRSAMGHYARKKGAAGVATADQIAARWDYYGGLCWMCGQPATETDHVIALNRGGSDWPSNQRPACGPCNKSKGDRPTTY